MFLILALIAVVTLGHIFFHRRYSYWTRQNVEQGQPVFLLGHFKKHVLRQQSFPAVLQDIYNISPDKRYCGVYQFMKPVLMLKDPDLIKQIAVKDYEHFFNHFPFLPANAEPLWGKNLLFLKDQKWRDMRSTLSPAFTSSKMKLIFSLISENSEQFVRHFLKKEEKVITAEMKDVLSRFSNDVIANVAFGLKCDSLEEENNEFYVKGKQVTNFSSPSVIFKIFLYFLIPKFYDVVKMAVFPTNVTNFFRQIIEDTILVREKNAIKRPDMINLLLEARKHGFKHEELQTAEETGFATVQEADYQKHSSSDYTLTNEDITAQALVFFFAGFETISSLMCFMSHELAINTDVQEKLIKEVDETAKNCNGKVTYDALMKMKYLDMTVSETLRKWPSNLATDRLCTKPYTIQPQSPHEKPVHLPKDSSVWIPIFPIHRDPNNFPDPERFDPERFSEENKSKIKPYTYMPFGVGPRNCIGSRFALMEAKILFYHLLLHFEIVPVEKTDNPLQLVKGNFILAVTNGFWLGLKRRSK